MINVFIDYDIILQSDLDTLKDELELIIATGKYIFVWHKTISVEQMAYNIVELGIKDYIWGYRQKDSMHYGAVDFIIDSDPKIVEMFARQGIPGNVIDRL